MKYNKKPKWIKFVDISFKDSKTKRWAVCSETTGAIGYIRWYGRWRKYAFFPNHSTVYEQDCMRDISDFIESETKEHKKQWRKHGDVNKSKM